LNSIRNGGMNATSQALLAIAGTLEIIEFGSLNSFPVHAYFGVSLGLFFLALPI